MARERLIEDLRLAIATTDAEVERKIREQQSFRDLGRSIHANGVNILARVDEIPGTAGISGRDLPHRETPVVEVSDGFSVRLVEKVQAVTNDGHEILRYHSYGLFIEEVAPSGESRNIFGLYPHMVTDWQNNEIKPNTHNIQVLQAASFIVEKVGAAIPPITSQ